MCSLGEGPILPEYCHYIQQVALLGTCVHSAGATIDDLSAHSHLSCAVFSGGFDACAIHCSAEWNTLWQMRILCC